jgi:HAD superfamily phosphatase (TIGR01681 family)
MTKTNFKAYVFDLDNTLYFASGEATKTHSTVKENLEELKKQGKKLFVATHNKHPEIRLKKLGIEDLFDGIICEKKDVHPWFNSIQDFTSKKEMIQNIIDSCGLSHEDVIFFDDVPYNINEVAQLGVRCVLVDTKTGINFEEFLSR